MANLLFILSGSIAAYKACDAISRLVQRGHKVRTIATPAALNFIGPSTLEGLTGEPVRSELFSAGTALEHIELDRWADALVVCPATAHTLNRFAAGLADDLAGSVYLAHDRRKPCLLAPAMNPAMWAHPATQAAITRLQSWGDRLIDAGVGRTACGEEGQGRLAEPDDIVRAIEASLAKPARSLRVLITSGGTSESIDGVRVITNTSTGRTGVAIAAHFSRQGHQVHLLRARSSLTCPGVSETVFQSFADLDVALKTRLTAEDFDAVVHAAAVGDFAVSSVSVGGAEQPAGVKLDTSGDVMLCLKPQPKLVNHLRERSRNPALQIIAFKLTRGIDTVHVKAAVEKLLAQSGASAVVHNDIAADAGGDSFPTTIYPRSGPPVECPTRSALPVALENLLLTALST